jgi:hypothetical protein
MTGKPGAGNAVPEASVPQAESMSGSAQPLKQIVAELQRENKLLRRKTRSLKITVAEAKQRCQVLELERTRLAKEHDALRKSLSWRLTFPLRAVIDTCRTIGGKRPVAHAPRAESDAEAPQSPRSVPARKESRQRIKPPAVNKDRPTVGVIIFTCGEPQFEACWQSINAQTLGPDRIDVVRDVYPISAAFNEALRLLTCDYAVTLDADIVLDPDALEMLYKDISSSDDNVFAIGYRLRDPYYGSIGFIKIYKSSLLRSRKVHDKCGFDRLLLQELSDEGYTMLRRAETLGVHLPNPTPEQLFKRALGTARKFLKFRDDDKTIKHMARRWCVENDKTAFAGLIGYCGGLLLEHQDEEKDFRTFGKKEWSRINWMFEP